MHSALDRLLAVGEASLPVVWIPVLAWTVAALVAEAALRLRPGHHPLVGLGVRRALLWALPAGVLAALALPGLLPPAAVEQVLAVRPAGLLLPEITVGVAPAAEAPTAAEAAPVALVPLLAGLALLAVAGLGVLRLGRVVGGLVALRRLSSGAAAEAVQREAEAAARAAGVRREVRAVATAVPTVPFTFGWRRPVVVVPADLADDPEALRLVLAHEVAHIARGDFAAGVAERVLTALFGWHPLVGVFARRIDLDRERATDAAVLATHPTRRRDYASLLLSFSRLPSPALALGAAPGAQSLTTRITDMNRSPLSADRLRSLGYAARLIGAALFVLAVGAAALVALGPNQTQALAATLGAGDIALTQPVVTIDGVEVMEGDGTISSQPFAVITAAVGGWGRFLVSDRPFEGAELAGSFYTDRIEVRAGGHDLRIALGAPPFVEERERRAYARFDAFPEAAPLAPGDPRLEEVWFSVSSSFENPMPLRATYRDRMLYGADETLTDELAGVLGETSAAADEARTLEGRIVDAQTGEPIEGVSLQVVGTAIGAATDADGRFVINGVEPGDEVRVRITHPLYQMLTWIPRTPSLNIGLVPQAADMLGDDREPGDLGPAAPRVFASVEDPPRLIGGLEGLADRIVYPAAARREGVQGIAYIEFVVDETGTPTEVGVKKSAGDARLDAAAVAAVEGVRFRPGRQYGQAVKVRFTLPVRFALPAE